MSLPDLSEFQAAWIIGGLVFGLWLLIFAGFSATHIHHVKSNGKDRK